MLEQFGKMEFTPAHRGSAPQCHTFMSASCLVMASKEMTETQASITKVLELCWKNAGIICEELRHLLTGILNLYAHLATVRRLCTNCKAVSTISRGSKEQCHTEIQLALTKRKKANCSTHLCPGGQNTS